LTYFSKKRRCFLTPPFRFVKTGVIKIFTNGVEYTATMKKTENQSKMQKIDYQRNAEVYKLLANPLRLKIIDILKDRDVSLDELSEILKIRKPNTSQHLTILRYLKIVSVRREGQKAIYKIADKRVVELTKIFQKLWGSDSF